MDAGELLMKIALYKGLQLNKYHSHNKVGFSNEPLKLASFSK